MDIGEKILEVDVNEEFIEEQEWGFNNLVYCREHFVR